MKKINVIALLVMFIVLSSTVIGQASKIYSVDINNVEKKVAIDYMANELIGNGFTIMSANDYMIVCRKDADDFWTSFLYGSKFNSTPEARITYNFAQINNVIKVVAEARIVTNPNSAYEKSQVIENKAIQQMLDRFKQGVEQQFGSNITKQDLEHGFGFSYASSLIGGNVFVSKIIPGSGAERSGLKFGDRITKVNNVPITTIDNFNYMIKSLSLIELTVKTDDQDERVINLSKIF